ncbi:unnamed protein product, partial [Rotaria sp. Silwood1]
MKRSGYVGAGEPWL